MSLTEKKCHLTARTRNKDDFPAFCNPTMVTSISVALHHRHGSIAVRNILLGLSLAAFAFDAASPTWWILLGVKRRTNQNSLSSQS